MNRFIAALVVSMLVASCATTSITTENVARESTKECSGEQRNALTMFLQGMAELDLSLMREAVAEGMSLFGVFGDSDARRGREVVRQIAANPAVVGEGGSCTCSLLDMSDTADPNVKIIRLKRLVTVGDDLREYKRTFRVRFAPHGNCILTIDSVDTEWIRM